MAGAGALVVIGIPGTALAASAATATAPTSSPAPASGQGWIRFGHFSRSNGPVAVAIDGTVIAADAAFESVTPYQSVTAGPHVLSITDVGAPGATLTTTVTVAAGGADTVTALQGPGGLELKWFPDDLSAAPAGEAKVRVIDTLPTQPSLRAELASGGATADAFSAAAAGPPVLSTAGAAYGGASPYVDVPAGTYRVKVAGAEGMTVITGTNWPVAAGTVASIVVLRTARAATLEVLADAAGVAAAPAGAPQTGYGGAAGQLATRRRAAPVTASTRRAPVGGSSIAGRASVLGGQARAVSLAGAPTGVVATTPPDTLTIPSLGVDTAVEPLGRNADGTAQVPATTTDVGWYDDGPTPGQRGPAVIVGHVDSTTGPGVFFRLGELQPGALVQVGEGPSTVTFQVEQVTTYTKVAFPTSSVYGPVPDRALRLITCGGPFDHATGHYLDNVVVYASEVSPS